MRKTTSGFVASFAFTTALAASGAPAHADDAPPAPGIYMIDVTLAPVCLDGTFPLAIDADAGPVSGVLVVTTDVRGRVSGTLALPGNAYVVTGSVSFKGDVGTATLTARAGRERLTFSGAIGNGSFSGTVRGKGALAVGRPTFSADLASSHPLVASMTATLAAGRHGRLVGTGTADVCGIPLTLKASVTAKKSVRLTLSAKGGFRFTANGPFGSNLSWKAHGFGGNAIGSNLPLLTLTAPSGLAYTVPTATYEEEETITANAPVAAMPPLTTYSVAPTLPAGLSIDVATGVITGTPTTAAGAMTFTVTATNAAGSDAFDLSLAVRLNHARSFAPETDALDDDDLRHFLRRTQYGVRPSEITAIQTAGLPTYLDAMLTFPASPTTAETNAFALLVNATDPVGREGFFPTTTQMTRWWTQLMVETPVPFQETLAFFWHDHFGVTSVGSETSEGRWIPQHINLLRREGNGNLRTLLLDVSRDPQMLKFLDGIQNTKGRPNENYAREFWELFTLGVDNGYEQRDITEAARAWTGYRIRFDSSISLNVIDLDLSRHDTGSKSFFGQTISGQNATDDFAAVVDITLANRPVAEYITKKLFAYFCYENPPQSLVDAMAAELRADGYELKPFLKALLRSEAFFSKKARRNLVKSPVEYTLGFVRSTGLKITTNSLDSSLNNQGQRLTQPPTVDGWPSGDLWLSAQGMVERVNLAHLCVDDTTRQAGVGINVANLLPPVASRTADAVVDTLAQLLDIQLSPSEHTDLVGYLNTQRDAAGNVTASPFNGSSQQHLDERVRGLLYALAQHPTYHSR